MAIDVQALQAALRRFAVERGWDASNTPKNLATALVVEAAELAEIFQWLTPEASLRARDDPAARAAVADELADILIYLLQMADRTGVDLEQALAAKLERNAQRFPRVAGPAPPPGEPGPHRRSG